MIGEIDTLHAWRDAIESEMDERDSKVQELSSNVNQLKVTLKKEVKEKEMMEDAMGALKVQIFTIKNTKKDASLPLVKQVCASIHRSLHRGNHQLSLPSYWNALC